MRYALVTATLIGAFAAAPMVVEAASGAGPAQVVAKRASTASSATHATVGIVKSLDGSSLIIAPAKGKGANMTFTLNPATHREGTIEVGSAVSVRYRKEGTANVAMAVTVQHPKAKVVQATKSTR